MDINNDSLVNPLDALWAVNAMNLDGSHALSKTRVEGVVKPFLDVNRDGHATPMDALWIINYLNQQAGGEGEGEGTAGATASTAPVIDLLMSR